ncbi:Phage transcriptional activator, Ogr/delta [Erwinia billingiae Eb661]|uniref:Phage transcriptional activator, Ogr/delta n=1 Tax=Erwinia billingiae (strain Eb661) TaxID=634500 RepID=D8MKK3_ERWBE|nr:ogr/Delta-like zinc finger family protein [Erwinia billingiae]CAX57659.1 Phage transcriptional activator, Ogr/delta [Erwinia billingiae Eb661]
MFTCPKCNASAKTRTSVRLSELTRRSYHQCNNLACGVTFTTLDSVEHFLNHVTPVAAHNVPKGIFPSSNYGDDQLALSL